MDDINLGLSTLYGVTAFLAIPITITSIFFEPLPFLTTLLVSGATLALITPFEFSRLLSNQEKIYEMIQDVNGTEVNSISNESTS